MDYKLAFKAFIAGLFGLGENATDVQVHQATIDNANVTLESMKAGAIEAAKEAVKADIAALTGKVSTMEVEIETAKTQHSADMAAINEKLSAAETRANTAEAAAAEAATKVATLTAENATLSKEVATLKTTQRVDGGEGDAGLSFLPGGKAKATGAVENKSLADYFAKL